ncbi:phosphoserine phosphatase SerB [Nesterenkonia muleiensis]|uniref:phosphoserine phosphatase SerB n=1 Tax=Nesterenkonia muleiensis TaxID=2282648 RepID=UPI001EE43231|nr:phosphoserine phosphatase SerB [Nesterenkonia muleiensis]
MTDRHPGTVATIAAEGLDGALIRSLTAEFERRGTVHHTEAAEFATGTSAVRAVRWFLELADADDDFGTQLIQLLLDDAAEQTKSTGQTKQIITTAVLPAPQRPTDSLMLVMDVDSTLIDQEVIDLLAAHAGRAEEVAAVTERAMRGELDFTQSLHARVRALGGLSDTVLHETFRQLTPSPGARGLIAICQRHQWPVYAVSGGFRQILEPLAAELGLTGFDANTLEIAHGQLTGAVAGQVVDRAVKRQRLLEWAGHHRIGIEHVVAVGDGANDLDMVNTAGVGVAFCAKPALAEQADLVINHRSMELIAYALGLPLNRD